MEKLNERINSVINNLGIKQTVFAERLNLSQAFVSQLCSGAKQPSNRTISDICREFNVSKEWIRTGKGRMFITIPEEDGIASHVEVLTQGNRVKKLRKELGLTQEEFGEKLGLKKNSISQIENGVNSLTEQLSLSICREFRVSQEWLRTGKGRMFITIPGEDGVASHVEVLTQGNRVKKLRKELGYTLDKFGAKLGVHKSAISKIEKGENNLTEQMFLSICREFHVNQEWLRTGEGEMFVPASEEDAIAAYIKYLLSDNSDSELYNLTKSIMLIKSIMCIYNELSPKSQEILRDAINKLVENLKKEKGD